MMASVPTEILKLIPLRSKGIVYGYLKELGLLVGYDENLQIPMLISSWCLLFYHLWDTFKKSEKVKVNEAGNIATIDTTEYSCFESLHGTLQINKKNFDGAKCIWRVKMIKESRCATEIGISNGMDDDSETIWHRINENGSIKSSLSKGSGEGFRLNEIVSVILDVGNRTIAFRKEPEFSASPDQVIRCTVNLPFDNGESYHLLIRGTSITMELVSFEITNLS